MQPILSAYQNLRAEAPEYLRTFKVSSIQEVALVALAASGPIAHYLLGAGTVAATCLSMVGIAGLVVFRHYCNDSLINAFKGGDQKKVCRLLSTYKAIGNKEIFNTILKDIINYSTEDEKLTGYGEIFEALIQHGGSFDLNLKNDKEDTLLHFAVRYKLLGSLKRLLELRVNPNLQNKDGQTPLQLPQEYGHLESRFLVPLLKHGAILENGDQLLQEQMDRLDHSARVVSRPETSCDVFSALVQSKNTFKPNLQNTKGNTPLHFAARYGLEEDLKRLLELEADPTHQNEEGKTALIIAIEAKQLNTVKVLADRDDCDAQLVGLDVKTGFLSSKLESNLKFLVSNGLEKAARLFIHRCSSKLSISKDFLEEIVKLFANDIETLAKVGEILYRPKDLLNLLSSNLDKDSDFYNCFKQLMLHELPVDLFNLKKAMQVFIREEDCEAFEVLILNYHKDLRGLDSGKALEVFKYTIESGKEHLLKYLNASCLYRAGLREILELMISKGIEDQAVLFIEENKENLGDPKNFLKLAMEKNQKAVVKALLDHCKFDLSNAYSKDVKEVREVVLEHLELFNENEDLPYLLALIEKMGSFPENFRDRKMAFLKDTLRLSMPELIQDIIQDITIDNLPREVVENRDLQGTLLAVAFKSNKRELACKLLDRYEINMEMTSKNKRTGQFIATPLVYAVRECPWLDYEKIQKMLERGADPLTKSVERQRPPLFQAIHSGKEELVSLFISTLRSKQTLDKETLNEILFQSVKKGLNGTVQNLLEDPNIDFAGRRGATILMMAIRSCDSKIVLQVIEKLSNDQLKTSHEVRQEDYHHVALKQYYGNSYRALDYAYLFGRIPVIQALLDRGITDLPDKNILTKPLGMLRGVTADYAMTVQHLVQQAISSKVSIERQMASILSYVARNGLIDLFDFLIEKFPQIDVSEDVDHYGLPLLEAVSHQQTDIAQRFIQRMNEQQKPILVASKSEQPGNVLHIAIGHRNKDLVKSLLNSEMSQFSLLDPSKNLRLVKVAEELFPEEEDARYLARIKGQ